MHLKERFSQFSSLSFYIHVLGLPADLFYLHHSFLGLNDQLHQLNVSATVSALGEDHLPRIDDFHNLNIPGLAEAEAQVDKLANHRWLNIEMVVKCIFSSETV